MADDLVLRLDGVRKRYNVGLPSEIEVLHGLGFELRRGEFAALIGPSGSGKTTLLNLLGQLDSPTEGEIELLGQPTRALDDDTRTRLRGEAIGFVFQFHHLLPAFTALENVMMPRLAREGRPTPALIAEAKELLEAVGLGTLADRKPMALSGGQQQRVAIVRALMARPALLLADEPTGNLDTQTADEVFALLRRLHAERGFAVLVVTHDPRLADRCDRVIELVDGRIVSDGPRRAG
ncbi:ABC transporter ATP-binding protein [Silanimonas sp.]|uniref:ABC transporter ATP-binding protein n=1 Tax=Silanimonas sp. TaxID=1929290 RepID=UPI0037CC0435